MNKFLLAAAMTAATALGAAAETFPATDPLSQMIIRQTVAQANGGVRGVVAVKGASAPIEISPLSAEAKAAPVQLAAKADPRDLALKTAPPLQGAKKKAKKGKAPKTAHEQLRHVAAPAKGWR